MDTEYRDLADAEVLDNTGKHIDKDQLPKLLKTEVLALIWLGPRPIRPVAPPCNQGRHLGLCASFACNACPVPAIPPPLRPSTSGQTPHAAAWVGQILIVGNEKTSQDAILKAIPFFPGQVIKPAELRKAEENLKRSDSIAQATVRVVESSEGFQDILVTVKEK